MGQAIARRGMKVIYGAGKTGLMGAVADGALDAGGEVIGVIPTLFNTPVPSLTRVSPGWRLCPICTSAKPA